MVCLVGVIDLLHDVLHLGLDRKNGNKDYGELQKEALHTPNMILIELRSFNPIPGVYPIHSSISPSKTKAGIPRSFVPQIMPECSTILCCFTNPASWQDCHGKQPPAHAGITGDLDTLSHGNPQGNIPGSASGVRRGRTGTCTYGTVFCQGRIEQEPPGLGNPESLFTPSQHTEQLPGAGSRNGRESLATPGPPTLPRLVLRDVSRGICRGWRAQHRQAPQNTGHCWDVVTGGVGTAVA